MEEITLQVSGMSCAHCEKAVINTLTDMGVQSVTASAQNDTVEITYDPSVLTLDTIKNELNSIGYTCS